MYRGLRGVHQTDERARGRERKKDIYSEREKKRVNESERERSQGPKMRGVTYA